MKKILVTGGAGYIGSHTVVELTAAGYTPIIVDNLCNTSTQNIEGIEKIIGNKIKWHNVDCTDKKCTAECSNDRRCAGAEDHHLDEYSCKLVEKKSFNGVWRSRPETRHEKHRYNRREDRHEHQRPHRPLPQKFVSSCHLLLVISLSTTACSEREYRIMTHGKNICQYYLHL